MRIGALATIFTLLLPLSLLATTITIPTDQPTIQAGIDHAAAGDTILLMPGTYHEHDILLTSAILIRGSTGNPEDVVVSAESLGSVFVLNECTDVRFEAFTIRDGSSEGIHSVNSDLSLADMVLIENAGGLYSAVDSGNSKILLAERCQFLSNTSTECGGGVRLVTVSSSQGDHYAYLTADFLDCVFAENSSEANGGGLSCQAIHSNPGMSEIICNVTGSLFYANEADGNGGALYAWSESNISSDTHMVATLQNSTFWYNSSGISGGGIFAREEREDNPCSVDIANCIISDCPIGGGIVTENGAEVTIACSDVHGNLPSNYAGDLLDQTGINGNISEAPLFCDSSVGDFSIHVNSPCAADNNDCGVCIGAETVGCGFPCIQYMDYFPDPAPALSEIDLPGSALGVDIYDNYAIVAAWSNGIQIVDVTDVENPVLVSSAGDAYCFDVSVMAHYAVTAHDYGVKIYDIADPVNPVELSYLAIGGDAVSVVASGGLAYVASHHSGFKIVDVTDPTAPHLLSTVSLGGTTVGVDVQGDYAYVTNIEDLSIIDVSDPAAPFVTSNIHTEGWYLDVNDDLAYVPENTNGEPKLRIFDISDPYYPSSISVLSLPGVSSNGVVKYDQGVLYNLTREHGCNVIDVSEPTDPVIIGLVSTNGEEGKSIAIGPNFIAIPDHEAGLKLLWPACDPDEDSGTIIVDVEPAEVGAAMWVLESADISLTGSGDSTIVGMQSGEYSITWSDVDDWITPLPDTLELVPGGTVIFQGLYEAIPSIETFSLTFGGSDTERGSAVLEGVDDGYIIAGRNDSWSIQGEWVFKIDELGEEVWSRHYQSNGYHSFKGLDYSTEGYVLTGYSGGAYADLWIMNIDLDGEEVFNELFNTDGNAWNDGNAVLQTSDGGYIALGRTAWGWPNHAWYLIRTDSNGSQLWERVYDESTEAHDTEAGRDLAQTSDGGFILVGSYLDNPTDARLVKVDSLGEVEWDRSFGGGQADGFTSICTLDNGFLIAGSTSSYGSGGSDGWIVRTDSLGDEVWSQTYGGSADDGFSAVELDPSGGFILTGASRSEGSGEADLWLLRVDEVGDVLWSRVYGGAEDDDGTDVKPTSDGGYIVTGGTKSFGGGDWDVWVLKTDEEGLVDSLVTAVEDGSPAYLGSTFLQNFPNPFNPKTTIRFNLPEASQVALTVHDITGRLVSTLLTVKHLESGVHEVEWNGLNTFGHEASSGVYFVRLISSNHSESMKVVLLR